MRNKTKQKDKHLILQGKQFSSHSPRFSLRFLSFNFLVSTPSLQASAPSVLLMQVLHSPFGEALGGTQGCSQCCFPTPLLAPQTTVLLGTFLIQDGTLPTSLAFSFFPLPRLPLHLTAFFLCSFPPLHYFCTF